MKDEYPFSAPRNVTDISDCYFYHVMDLPGYGLVGKEWDLRGGEESYLGGVSLQGKRVLELGTASGYLCRYMESKGADLIGFDLSFERSWDLVPFAGLDIDSFRVDMKNHIEKLKNGWWFANRLLGSKAKAVYGNIYEIPEDIGPVDIATFGSILLHLRDPFQALYSALRLTREVAVVTEVHPEQPDHSSFGVTVHPFIPRYKRILNRFLLKTGMISTSTPHTGCMYFLPNSKAKYLYLAATWWCFPPEAIGRFLGVLGFEDQTISEHFQTFQGKPVRHYTVVGKRTHPFERD